MREAWDGGAAAPGPDLTPYPPLPRGEGGPEAFAAGATSAGFFGIAPGTGRWERGVAYRLRGIIRFSKIVRTSSRPSMAGVDEERL